MKCRKTDFGFHSQRGVALVLTVIMLAIITVVTLIFIGTARRNRSATTVRIHQTTAEFAGETALEHARGKIVERILRDKDLLSFDFLVSHPDFYGTNEVYNGQVIPTNHWVIPRVHNTADTVNVYLDLNRDRLFNDPLGEARPYGDPIWMGILDRPWLPHSRENRYVARMAYFVQPVGKSLDLNTIHNDTSPNPGQGFLRNQGVGPWELNLAAFFHEFEPTLWDYDYGDALLVNRKPEAWGNAFGDARSFLNYRHGIDMDPPVLLDGMPFSQVYPDAFTYNAFPLGSVDIYSDGFAGIVLGADALLPDDDLPNKNFRWAGADTTNHYFHIQELFDHADVGGFGGRSNKVTFEFYERLTNAITADGSRYYRLLAQLGTDTGSDVDNKINLNWVDQTATFTNLYATNFVPWNATPELSHAFFTNVAQRLFLAQSNEFNPATNALIVRSMFEIPVSPTNLYSSGIHRILQLAANILDATSTNQFPTVFRPQFYVNGTYVAVTNWVYDTTVQGNLNNLNDWGVPLVVGAKKGLPNFNELSIMSEFLASRKLEFVRPTTNSPPNMTNQMYTLGISNTLGVELWNSYRDAYPRGVTVIVSNYSTVFLTNEHGMLYSNVYRTAVTTNVPARAWRGIGNTPGNIDKLSFLLPTSTNYAFLTNSMYVFPPQNVFVPINTNAFQQDPNYRIPTWVMTLSNRMTCVVAEDNGSRVVDFAYLHDTFVVDLTKEILSSQSPYPNGSPANLVGLWSTNRTSANGPTDGILRQIEISKDEPYYALSAADWVNFAMLRSANDKNLAVANFRDFLRLPQLPGYPSPKANSSLAMQAPFNPAAKLLVSSTWQANDPLVHYHGDDLRFGPKTNAQYLRPKQSGSNLPPATLGDVNVVYSPWHGNPNQSTYPESGDFRIKDAGVNTSDDWKFPTNTLASVGVLGRVHRGTPWQTVYLKDAVADQTAWSKQSADFAFMPGRGNVARSHPTNDWRLADIFTTAIDARMGQGLVSINQTNLETWSALFSGVLVVSNTMASPQIHQPRTYDELLIEPFGGDTNQPFFKIWQSLFLYQSNKLARGESLRSIGEIIQNVPELTTFSPYLNLDRAAPNTPHMNFGMDDFAYEQIPQQILSLLRTGEPRFVIYAYGQALQPQRIDPASGTVLNYEVTAEFATRTVVRVEGNPRGRVRTVVESFNILPPD